MARYIDAEKAIRHLRGACVAKYPASFYHGIFASADEIDKLPTADVEEVRHGEWIPCGDGEHTPLMCSSCFDTWGFYKQRGSVYCPNCGAKMDGGKE